MTNNEYAEMEATAIYAEDNYFNARRGMDCENSRMMFRAGFERGYLVGLDTQKQQTTRITELEQQLAEQVAYGEELQKSYDSYIEMSNGELEGEFIPRPNQPSPLLLAEL